MSNANVDTENMKLSLQGLNNVAPTLASSFMLKTGQQVKNRLFKSAMSEQLGTTNHNPIAGLAILYKRWAEGGIGLSMTGNIMIERHF